MTTIDCNEKKKLAAVVNKIKAVWCLGRTYIQMEWILIYLLYLFWSE